MTAVRETRACGATIRVDHSDPAPIAERWRSTHPCDRPRGFTAVCLDSDDVPQVARRWVAVPR